MQLSVKNLPLAKGHLKHIIDFQKFQTCSSSCFVEVGSVSQVHPGMTCSESAKEEGSTTFATKMWCNLVYQFSIKQNSH